MQGYSDYSENALNFNNMFNTSPAPHSTPGPHFPLPPAVGQLQQQRLQQQQQHSNPSAGPSPCFGVASHPEYVRQLERMADLQDQNRQLLERATTAEMEVYMLKNQSQIYPTSSPSALRAPSRNHATPKSTAAPIRRSANDKAQPASLPSEQAVEEWQRKVQSFVRSDLAPEVLLPPQTGIAAIKSQGLVSDASMAQFNLDKVKVTEALLDPKATWAHQNKDMLRLAVQYLEMKYPSLQRCASDGLEQAGEPGTNDNWIAKNVLRSVLKARRFANPSTYIKEEEETVETPARADRENKRLRLEFGEGVVGGQVSAGGLKPHEKPPVLRAVQSKVVQLAHLLDGNPEDDLEPPSPPPTTPRDPRQSSLPPFDQGMDTQDFSQLSQDDRLMDPFGENSDIRPSSPAIDFSQGGDSDPPLLKPSTDAGFAVPAAKVPTVASASPVVSTRPTFFTAPPHVGSVTTVEQRMARVVQAAADAEAANGGQTEKRKRVVKPPAVLDYSALKAYTQLFNVTAETLSDQKRTWTKDKLDALLACMGPTKTSSRPEKIAEVVKFFGESSNQLAINAAPAPAASSSAEGGASAEEVIMGD